ncbi:lamin tail domain-containing protein, partial [candidate division KSB1 bacterium]
NCGDQVINLKNWIVTDGSGKDNIIGKNQGTSLFPGEYALILDPDYFLNSSLYDSLIPENTLILTIGNNTFGSRGFSNSTAERISIISETGDTVSSYIYTTDNLNGHSDEKMIPGRSGEYDLWGNSKKFNGTPGFRNSITPLDLDISIKSFDPVPEYIHSGDEITLISSIINNGIITPSEIRFEIFFDKTNDNIIQFDELIEQVNLDPEKISCYRDSITINTVVTIDISQFLIFHALIISSQDEDPLNDTLSCGVNVLTDNKQIILTEIMSNPLSGMPEWIEIYNRGKSDVNLKEWHVRDASISDGRTITQNDDFLAAGEYLILSDDPTAIEEFYPFNFRSIEIPGFPSLNNDEDIIILSQPDGIISDSVHYSGSFGFNKGVSLEKISIDSFINSSVNWSLSTSSFGATPGQTNSLNYHNASDIKEGIKITVDPNPFVLQENKDCDITINTSLPQCNALIMIFDRYGRTVRDLVKGESRGSSFLVEWDGKSNSGELMPTGIYIIYVSINSLTSQGAFEEKTTVVLVNN